jgi:hypothetical protein
MEGVCKQSVEKIFGPNREKVTGELRKLHKEEFHILSPSTNIIRIK